MNNKLSSLFLKIKNNFFNILLLAVAAFAIYAKGPTVYNNFKTQKGPPPAPINIERLSGETLSFPVLGEKKLVLFWMINCGPCKLEMNRINEMVKQGHLTSEQVIAINFVDDKSQVVEYLKSVPFNFLIALDTRGDVSYKFKVNSTPTIFLFNEDGSVDWATSGISPTLSFRIKNFFN